MLKAGEQEKRLEDEMEGLQGEVAELEERLSSYKELLARRDEEIGRLRKMVADRERRLSRRMAQVSRKRPRWGKMDGAGKRGVDWKDTLCHAIYALGTMGYVAPRTFMAAMLVGFPIVLTVTVLCQSTEAGGRSVVGVFAGWLVATLIETVRESR